MISSLPRLFPALLLAFQAWLGSAWAPIHLHSRHNHPTELSITSTSTYQPLLWSRTNTLSASTTTPPEFSVEDLTKPERKVYDLIEKLHDSHYKFRIVVVGHGAILETTHAMGPLMELSCNNSNQSILTLASPDQSFEFHMKLAEVSKIVLVEKEAPNDSGKRMRLLRFLSVNGNPMCSLILQNDSDKAVAWYQSLYDEYGQDVQL